LATISAVKDIGDSFKDIFTACLDVGRAIGPVARVTEILNLPTNLPDLKRVNRTRRRKTKEYRTPAKLAELRLRYGTRYGSDAVPIILQDMCFTYSESDGANIIKNVNLRVQQGNLVAVVGNRRGGKSTLMKLLGNVLFPTKGFYFVPSFLRILHVTVEPTLLNRSLWTNLAIGRDYWRDEQFEADRIVKICRRIGLSRELVDQLEEAKAAFLAKTEDTNDISWQTQLSQSEKVLIHLARAFIYNPEVLVMNKPTVRLPDNTANLVIQLISEFVNQKGVELPQQETWRRRPRTAFVSFVRLGGVQAADVVWKVDTGSVTAVEKDKVSMDWIR
jgi:ABC-type multidrug transport system fused ATPase/permease subunit